MSRTDEVNKIVMGFPVWMTVDYSISVISEQRQLDLFNYFIDKKDRKVCVEIGTYEGLTAVVLAEKCVRIETFDIRDYLAKYKIWYMQNKKRNINFHLVTGDAEKSNLINQMDFDFAFIDGSHMEGVVKDFEMVKKCGSVLFHDYNNQNPELKVKYHHVIDLVDSLPKDEVEIKPPFAYWEKK